MFDHWFIQRCLVDVILAPTPSATTKLQAEDIPNDGSVLPLIIGMQFRKNESVYYSSVNAGVIISLETRFAYINEEPHNLTATVLNPRYKLRLTNDSVQKDNADYWADGRS